MDYAYGSMKLGMNGESMMNFKLNLLTYEIEGEKIANRSVNIVIYRI